MRELNRIIAAVCIVTTVGVVAPEKSHGTPAPAFDETIVDHGDDAAIARLREALQRRDAMPSLEAKFRQTRTTPLLARPIESTGTVRHVQGITLWTTESPRRSLMRITKREVEMLHFEHGDDGGGAVHERHTLDDRSAALAAIGPEPDLQRLTSLYSVTEDAQLQCDRNSDAWLAVRLTPRERDERSSIEAISLLVDLERGLIVRVVTHDRDGGNTSTEFLDIRERPELTVDDVAPLQKDDGAAGAGA